jgi:hypothetical protein
LSGEYFLALVPDESVKVHVRWTTRRRRAVTDYAVVLTVEREGVEHTVRVYDGAHGVNELHRYTRTGGKQSADIFNAGDLGEGMREALDDCQRRYPLMIEGWDR